LDFYQANRQSVRVVRLGLVSKEDGLARVVTRADGSVDTVPSDTALGLVWDGAGDAGPHAGAAARRLGVGP
jgi:hypothetical protein